MTLADKLFTDTEIRQHTFDPDEIERDDEIDGQDNKGIIKEED